MTIRTYRFDSTFTRGLVGGAVLLAVVAAGLFTGYLALATGDDGTVEYYDPPACPFVPQEQRTIVVFSERADEALVASDPSRQEIGPRSVDLPAGEYTVSLASYDGYTTRASTSAASQSNEQWFVRFFGAEGALFESGSIGDLQDGVEEAFREEEVGTLTLAERVTAVRAVHPEAGSSQPHSLKPVCAAFDYHAPEEPAPVCELIANPTELELGESSILSWTSEHADNAEIDQGVGEVATSGSRSVTPDDDTTYTATFTGEGGTVTCTATVTVDEPEEPETLTCPLNPGDYDAVLDFTEGGTKTREELVLRAHQTWDEAHLGPVDFMLETGTYDVTLVSYDNHSEQQNPAQEGEQWELVLLDTAADWIEIAITNAISDLPDDQDYLTEVVNTELVVANDADAALARHANFHPSDTNPKSIVPVCAAFKKEQGGTDGGTDGGGTDGGGTDGGGTDGGGTDGGGTDGGGTTGGGTSGGSSTSGGGGPCLNCNGGTDGGGTSGGGGTDGGDEEEPMVVLSSVVREAPQGGFVYLSQVPYTGFEAGPFATALFWFAVLALSACIAYFIVTKRVFQRVLFALFADSPSIPTGTLEQTYADVYPDAFAHDDERTHLPGYRLADKQEDAAHIAELEEVVEERMQQDNVLLSPEATTTLCTRIRAGREDTQQYLGGFVERAKERYPREDGWILLSNERVAAIMNDGAEAESVAAPHENAEPAHEHDDNPRAGVEEYAHEEVVTPAEVLRSSQREPAGVESGARPETVATFVVWLADGQQQKVFEFLRKITGEAGRDVEAFIGQVVRELDEVYKQRLEGDHSPNQDLARSTATWSNGDFEHVLGCLVESVDYSYSSTRIGTKVALAKVFEYFSQKNRHHADADQSSRPPRRFRR